MRKLTGREQLLAALGLLLAIGAAWFWFRYLPVGKALAEQERQAAAARAAAMQQVPPRPPDADAEKLASRKQEVEAELAEEEKRREWIDKAIGSREDADLLLRSLPAPQVPEAPAPPSADPEKVRKEHAEKIAEVERARARVAELSDQFEEEEWRAVLARKTPTGPEKPIDLKDLRRRLDEAAARLLVLEQQFANREDIEALQDLKVKVSTLAKSSNVRIRENVPFEAGPAPALNPDQEYRVDPETLARVCGRPLQKLTMDASLVNLELFLKGLADVKPRVVIVQMEIKQSSTRGGQFPLEVVLILAL